MSNSNKKNKEKIESTRINLVNQVVERLVVFNQNENKLEKNELIVKTELENLAQREVDCKDIQAELDLFDAVPRYLVKLNLIEELDKADQEKIIDFVMMKKEHELERAKGMFESKFKSWADTKEFIDDSNSRIYEQQARIGEELPKLVLELVDVHKMNMADLKMEISKKLDYRIETRELLRKDKNKIMESSFINPPRLNGGPL